MIEEALVADAGRLRDELVNLKAALRQYPDGSRQVTSDKLKRQAAQIAETWLVKFAPRSDVPVAISSQYHADLTVLFQRLLTCSEHATMRRKYDEIIRAISKQINAGLIVPLKQARALQAGLKEGESMPLLTG